jgi:hypothetical protein
MTDQQIPRAGTQEAHAASMEDIADGFNSSTHDQRFHGQTIRRTFRSSSANVSSNKFYCLVTVITPPFAS